MKSRIVIFLMFTFILTGCEQTPPVEGIVSEETSLNVVQSVEGEYKTTVPLLQMKSRGVNISDGSNNLNIENMEKGLLNISKQYVDTTEFYYQPGQIIDNNTATRLLERDVENDDSVIGVNPPKESEGEETKIYTNTFIEQNFYKMDSEGKKKIDTVSIAFGLDPTYVQGDKEIEIDVNEFMEYGNFIIANNMVEYIRSQEGYESVNIIFGFYLQSSDQQLPGEYIGHGIVKKEDKQLRKIEPIKEKYVAYPSENAQVITPEINEAVIKLQSSIYEYFSVSSAAYGSGHLVDGNVSNMKLTVIADIYSPVDIVNFISYIEAEIMKSFDISYDITVEVKRLDDEPIGIMTINEEKKVSKFIY